MRRFTIAAVTVFSILGILSANALAVVPVEVRPPHAPIRSEFEREGRYTAICDEAGCGRVEVSNRCPRGSEMLSYGFETTTRGDRITFGMLGTRVFGNEVRFTFGGGEGTGYAQEARVVVTCLQYLRHL